jgi:hypothetical protein
MDDFDVYVRWFKQSDYQYGKPRSVFSLKGRGAKNTFKVFDSTGKLVPTRQPNLLDAALRGKKMLNMQIKMWAEGWQDVSLIELMDEYDWLPPWVWDSFRKQRFKYGYG